MVRDEEWLVTAVEPATDGFFVRVVGLSELVRDTEAVFATAIDTVIESDPTGVRVVPDTSAGFRRSRLWLEALLRKTPVSIAEPALATARGALADPLDYQLAAVRQALAPDKLRPRILLADAVGLGKTLEIGMILAELVRRGRGDRILVVTPRHVLEQMQMELWTRFALPFVRLDSVGIQRIRQILPATHNPFTYYRRVIISIDTLKSERYLAHLRKQRWDAVVIDESHNVTNVASQNNRLARLLSARTDALILASATPHNGRAESFAELVRMLDPSAVRPDGELDLDQVRRLVIRRHRHHPEVAGVVGADWAERLPPHNVPVPASPAEDAIAAELEQVWLWPESGRSPYSGKNARSSSGGSPPLFPWVLAKAFLSSPAALAESVRARRSRLAADDPATARERAALDRLTELIEPARDSSAKYDALRYHLAEIGVARGSERRVVIFAERVATLTWLAEALRRDLRMTDKQVVVLHGGLADTEQQDVVESFKLESSPIRILVTGDVASEGVNLHTQCHHLVHYDIPWSLIRIEQRNGRIDRYGQRNRPQIATLLLTPATERFGGDVRVLTKLVEREHEAHTALGDSASLIGTYDVKAEEEAIRRVLAGERELDDVVRTVDEVAEGGGLDAFFAQLGLAAADQPTPTSDEPDAAPSRTTAVYDDEFGFLADAITEFEPTPQLAAPDGIEWQVHPGKSIAALTPRTDLQQRLKLLPQSYLRERRVTERYKLALTPVRGREELRQAREGDSRSVWPEAHFLAPLHPVLDWAADRALAELGRDQIFAVRGTVATTTVLVQVTHTNTGGQVLAASYYSVLFPDITEPAVAFAQPHTDAAAAVTALGLAEINAGPPLPVEDLQPLVGPAVRSADAAADQHDAAIRAETTRRIDPDDDVARAMNPDRRLTRPLLVVVPRESGE
ncbi:DEAD/DEAH box helicase [Skermania piniformis]|uniref:DEAD/DEAH box helicase n=1 Tax=Skermania pinensis TaxID=39122 RepID=A0ABX8SH20_9ACTN|nr:DEAD/DEAH box helicase [Skermania piniformis]